MDGSPHLSHFASPNFGGFMIVLGLLLLIIGFLTGIAILWSLGVIAVVVGLVLWILGSLGHAIGGRRHYF
jgi:hypothetical protein